VRGAGAHINRGDDGRRDGGEHPARRSDPAKSISGYNVYRDAKREVLSAETAQGIRILAA